MSIVRPSIPRSRGPRASAALFAVLLLLAAPLMAGCLERSTTVGDRYAGSVIVATTPDNPRGAPRFDIPESMGRNIAVTEYREGPTTESGGTQVPADAAVRVGSRATFTNLTAGQLGQLGDIVASSFGDTSMTMDLTAKRSGDVVRFRGSADLNSLVPGRDYLKLTISFAGPVTATNGDQDGETTVSWTPEPGKPADFTAEATYADPATAAFGGWSWLMGLLCAAVVLVVARLAYVSRDRSPRPGRATQPPAGTDTGTATSGTAMSGTATSGTATSATGDQTTSAEQSTPPRR